MSSLFNQTTGECISGVCKNIEAVSSFSDYKLMIGFILGIALFFTIAGIVVAWLESKEE